MSNEWRVYWHFDDEIFYSGAYMFKPAALGVYDNLNNCMCHKNVAQMLVINGKIDRKFGRK